MDKQMRNIMMTMIAVIVILAAGTTVLAAGSGSAADPFVGSGDLKDSYDGSITIHKYDIAAWEKRMKENPPQGAQSGFTIRYYGNQSTGGELLSGDQVGYYYLNALDEAADENRQPVYLAELEAISNITFRLQSAVPQAGKEGSVAVADYTITSAVDSYGKTDGGIMRWKGVAKGYYIITELANETTEGVIDPFVISMPMADPADIAAVAEMKDIHIYPKNKAKEGPDITKEITSDLENGNVVSWKVTADVPTDIATSLKYVITDTMSSGLIYAGNLRVFYIEGANQERELAVPDDYTAATSNVAGAKTELRITLTDAGRQQLGAAAVEKLYITYDTIVNLSEEEWENLANEAVNNEIKLEFQNEDGNEYEKGPGPIDVEDLGGVRITKKDGATSEPLGGVSFKIYTRLNAGGTDVDEDSVLKAEDGSEIVLLTNASGIAYYYGLGAGTYYLVETAVSGGYKLLSGYRTFVITAQMAQDHVAAELEILNYLDNGLTLPETGGRGTLLFTIAGIILIAAAGIVYLISRKRNRLR